MSVYVVTHKNVNIAIPDSYINLYVGAHKLHDRPEGYTFDDSCDDEISCKNKNYCELTGLYWIWKNDFSDIKGLVHYRRFFTKNRYSKSSKYYYSENEFRMLLKKYDLIVSERLYVNETNYENYCKFHKKKDWDNLKIHIILKYPDYKESFEKMENEHFFYPYNMIVAKSEVFDNYCKWLFGLLFSFENEVDLTGYDNHQSRIFGFLSERLLGVWLLRNTQYSFYCAPVIQTDSRFRYRIRRHLEKTFNCYIKL